MTLLKISLCVAAVAFLASCAQLPRGSGADGRMLIKAKVNGKPTKFGFDTGAETSVLYQNTADKLGLHYTNEQLAEAVPLGSVSVERAEECKLQIWGRTIYGTFAVLEVPWTTELDIDGLIAWSSFRSNIIQFDCSKLRYKFLRRLPSDISNWTSYPLRGDLDVLAFDVSNAVAGKATIIVDTGSMLGASLSADLWKRWTEANSKRLKTIEAFFMFGSGLVVGEQSWAEDLSIGPLNFTRAC